MRQDPPRSENAAFGTALWLVPHGDVYRRLSDRIQALATLHRSPVFPPHVTLLGGIRKDEDATLAAASHIAGATPALTIRLVAASVRDEYFRRLVLEAEPTDELRRARARAASALEIPESSFEPHLSLLYGRAAVTPEDAGIELPLRITCRALAIRRTEGPVAEWRLLSQVFLGSAGA